eukprot:1551660-Rhodomonas_salina.1
MTEHVRTLKSKTLGHRVVDTKGFGGCACEFEPGLWVPLLVCLIQKEGCSVPVGSTSSSSSGKEAGQGREGRREGGKERREGRRGGDKRKGEMEKEGRVGWKRRKKAGREGRE